MEDVIVCPNCGETNPADLLYCQHCQWRLRALDDEWTADRGSAAPPTTDGEFQAADEGASIPDWLRSLAQEAPAAETPPEPPPKDSSQSSPSNTGDDLLAGLSNQEQADEEEIPDWVARIMGINAARESQPTQPLDAGRRISDFTSQPDVEADRPIAQPWSAEPPAQEAVPGASTEIDESAAPASGVPAANESPEVYEWLRQLDASASKDAEPATPQSFPSGGDVPDWVEKMVGVQGATAQDAADAGGAVPQWLRETASGGEEPRGAPPETGMQGVARDQTGPREAEAAPSGAPAAAPPATQAGSADKQDTVPAFAPEDIQRIDVDAVFASMRMPDWLADLNRSQMPPSPEAPPASEEEATIGPAELPSWVEAMRPVESGTATPSAREEDLHLEERGPLLGLHGVLPAIPGAALPSGKPRSQSMKLDATEAQRAHAKLLEDLLASETQPLPLRGVEQVGSHRVLRWVIGGVLLLVLGLTVALGTSTFPLPAAVPNESIAAVQAVQSLPPDARVLAIFDYEPATVGEMEATAASLMDHLLLLKHPRLAVLSTSPTGSALAERFMSGILKDRAYVRDRQYVDLGYLPGGLAGVQSFAQNPAATVPLGAAAEPVWASGVLLGTQRLSDFDAIIVLTDRVESGRVWIEQTATTRGSGLMIMASSAQAGPLLVPYFDAGQLDGLVAGLNGAAGAEIANSGLPGLVRRYWDAYSLGLYLAALLITLGAFWQFWSRIRETRSEVA